MKQASLKTCRYKKSLKISVNLLNKVENNVAKGEIGNCESYTVDEPISIYSMRKKAE